MELLARRREFRLGLGQARDENEEERLRTFLSEITAELKRIEVARRASPPRSRLAASWPSRC